MVTEARFFKTPIEFRRWLKANHGKAVELWVGFRKVGSGMASITWKESVDEALCFGWIDGVRKSIDNSSYKIRFTPRRATSNWSKVNIKRFGELKKLGLVEPSGQAAFDQSCGKRRDYSYEQKPRKLDDAYEEILRKNKKAWEFFSAQAPWYQRVASFWVMSAKKEETRQKRLAALVRDSEAGLRLGVVLPKE